MIYMTCRPLYHNALRLLCIAAIQIEQHSPFDFLLVQSIDKEWQIGSRLPFIRFFSIKYPNINLESRQFAKQNITINK